MHQIHSIDDQHPHVNEFQRTVSFFLCFLCFTGTKAKPLKSLNHMFSHLMTKHISLLRLLTAWYATSKLKYIEELYTMMSYPAEREFVLYCGKEILRWEAGQKRPRDTIAMPSPLSYYISLVTKFKFFPPAPHSKKSSQSTNAYRTLLEVQSRVPSLFVFYRVSSLYTG